MKKAQGEYKRLNDKAFYGKKRRTKTLHIARDGYKLMLPPEGQEGFKCKWGGSYNLKVVPAGSDIESSTSEKDNNSSVSFKITGGNVGAEFTTDGISTYSTQEKIMTKNDTIVIEYEGINFLSKVTGYVQYLEIKSTRADNIYSKWENNMDEEELDQEQ